jgi:hypothetical protein
VGVLLTACLSDLPSKQNFEPESACLCDDDFRNNWATCRQSRKKRQVTEDEKEAALSAIVSKAVQAVLDSACLPATNDERDKIDQGAGDVETPADPPVDETPETSAWVDPDLGASSANDVTGPTVIDTFEEATFFNGDISSTSIETAILSQSAFNETALVEKFLTTTTPTSTANDDDDDSNESTATATDQTTAETASSTSSGEDGASSEDANQASGSWGSMVIALAAIMFTL